MTKSEYEHLYVQARRTWPRLLARATKEMKNTFLRATDLVAREIARAEMSGHSQLTIKSLTAIETQISEAGRAIAKKLGELVEGTITNGFDPILQAEVEYLVSAVKDAGAESIITTVKIRNLYAAIDETMIAALHQTVWQDGYSFSQRIWKVGEQYQVAIKRIVAKGLAAGLPAQKVAKDIQKFAKVGQSALGAKYGNIRIKNLDWRALRIVRSELGSAIRLGQAHAGTLNPAATGLYDWIRINTQQHDCACPQYAANSPYTFETIPSSPHPNCYCIVRPRLKDRSQFVQELKDFAEDRPSPDISRWYHDVFLPKSA